MQLDDLHDEIDESQTRTADSDYELIEAAEDIWQGKVDQIQAFCNEHARKLDDDTVLEEGLAKVGRISFELANASEREGEQELIVTRLIGGLERKIEEIRSDVSALEGEDERKREAEEILKPKSDESGPHHFGEVEEMRTEFDDLMDEIETDDQRKVFLDELIEGMTAEQETINLSEQQQLRVEQLRLVTVLFQSMVQELEHSTTSVFYSGLSESERLNLIGRYNEIVEDVIPRATTEIILNPEASLETIQPELVGRVREGTRISGDMNLISVLMATLRSVDRDNMMISLVNVTSMSDLQEQRAQVMIYLQSCKQYEGVRTIAEQALAKEIKIAKRKVGDVRKAEIEDEAGEYVRKKGERYRADWKEQGMTDEQIDVWLEEMKQTKIDHDLTVDALKPFTFTPASDVPPGKQHIWEIYNEVFNPQDQYLNMVEDDFDMVLREIMINAPLIVLSGGIANAGRSMARGALSIAARNLIAGTRLATYASRTYKASKFVKGVVQVGGFIGGAATEGFLFESAHSGMARSIGLEEKWLFELEGNEALGRVFWTSVALAGFHGVGRFAEGAGKQIDRHLAKRVLRFKGVANPEEFKMAIDIVAGEITNHAARKVIQALVVSGNLEAGLMLLLAAVQEGFYNGTLEDFFENFGEHIFHSYMAVASLKTSGTVTGKVMGRSTAPKPKKARPTARATRPPTDVGREAREASQSSVKIAEGELLLTSEGKVSIILREGDNFVISFQDSRGLTRMPVDQLRKIVDAVPREKQEAFQRESREAKERDGAEDQRMVEEAGGELALEMASIPGAHSPELIAKIPSGISPNETVIYRGITSDTFVIDPSSKYTQHFTDNYQAAKKFAGEEGQVVAIAVDRGMLGERVSDRVGGTEHHGGFGNFEFSSKEISRLHKEGKVAVEKSIAIKEGSQRPTEIVEGELLLTPEETILVLSREGNDLIVQFQDGTLPFRMPVDILQRMVDAVPREKQKAFQREQQEAKARESGRSRTEIAPDVTRFEGGEKVLTSEGEVLIVSLRGGHFVVRFKNRGSVLIKATELQALIDAVPPAERAAFRQRQIESPTSNVDAPPQTILESSKTYLTKDGTVSILMRDGDVFVVTFNNGTGIQRIPPRELQKIVDAIPPEKQEAAQRESRETSERFMEEHERKVEEAGGVLAYEMQTSPGAHSRELIGRILEIAPNETVVYRGVKSDSYVVKPETGPHDRIQHFTDSYKAAKSFAGPEGQVVAIAIDQARLLDNHLSTRGGGFEDRSGALNFELSYENIYGLYQKGKIAAEKGLQVREPGQPPKKRIAPKPPTEVAQENASLDDHARLVEAQKYVVEKDLLDTEGTPTEHGKAVLAAHEVGLGKEGSYSLAEIGEKRGILGEAGFSKAEMRTLMEYGFVGEAGRLTGAASRRPIEEITRDFESAMRGDKLVLSKAGSDHVMEFEVRRFDSERGAFWVNHKGVNYRVTVEMNETGNYDVVLKGIKERRISQVGEVSIEKGEWRARLESEKRAEVMEAEAYLRYPGIIREKTRDLGGNEVHNELGEPVEGMVRVGTGTGALVPRGQEVMTSGVYSCMAVFVRGPKGNALIHLTPSGAGGTLTYSPRTLSKEIYPEIADKLWEIGEPNELEVTLLVNSESNHQYPVKKAEWETARRLFQREGIENVALVEMPFSEGTHLYYSPDNPGEIIAVGGEARVAETGMLTGARTVGVTTRRIRLGEDVRMERPALTSDQIAEAMRDIPGNNDFKRANLAEQIELSLESGGGANPENAILYGRVCNDLLDGMNHSYAEFGKRYDLYYDKGLRRSITEGMERESAGNMLLSDLFHSINGIVGMKSSFEAKKDMIRAQLEATVDSFGKYQQNPTEEAFYISQSAEGLIREFGRGQTVDSTLTGQDTVRAPHKMLQSILYNLYKNAASVSKQHGYNDSLEITYRGRRVGDNIIISIYDNLPGFKPEQLSSLFDGTVESTSEWGHGTGLHRIAKQAELVGGTIESYHLVQEGGREVWKRKAPGSPPETVPRPEGVPEGSTKFFVLKLPAEPIVVAQAEPSTNRGPLLED